MLKLESKIAVAETVHTGPELFLPMPSSAWTVKGSDTP